MALRLSAFSLYLLTLNFVFHLYLYRRWLPGPRGDPRRNKRALSAALVTAVSLVAIQFLARSWPDSAARWLLFPALLWAGFALYWVGFSSVLDTVSWGWRRLKLSSAKPPVPERRAFLETAIKAGTLAASGGSAAFGTWRAYQAPEISEVEVRLPFLPKKLDGFALVQLSDVHIGAMLQRKFLEDLVARANGLKPDLVAITGDLVDGTVAQLGGHVSALRGLTSRHGTWFITGNHDYYSGADAWVTALSSMGIASLRNRLVSIGEGKASFDLLGVDDWSSRERGGYDLDAAVASRDPERASVLLAHQPQNLDAVASKGIGLQLSGHTHGGQMFPGTIVSDLLWGARSHGLSRFGGTTLYVSRGCGFVGPPQRGGSPPELVKVILRA